jgi:hypothetical protein
MTIRWRFGIVAGIFLAVFSLYPQMKMLYLRGDAWNGHYAYNDIDEVAYAAYIRALIDGRPRKNDPYTGRDDSPDTPQPESLFSIQFAAPYTIAVPARILGIGAPWAMTLGGAFAAFFAALALFWLIRIITEDDIVALAGTLVTLAGGALFAGEGAIGEITGWSYAYPYFPGFRRYIPAMAFPAFFLMLGCVWKLIGRETKNSSTPLLLYSSTSLAFAYTVYSYFYVWTTAVAWLGCLGICWLVFRPEGWIADIKRLVIVGIGCIVALVPYAYLLSQRSHTMDDVQLLVYTRALDLFRVPEIVGYIVLLLIAAAVAMKVLKLRDRSTLFAMSLALVPLIVFNQQLITGRSLQPIHYQVFIGNYVAGAALLITFGLLWTKSKDVKPVVRSAVFSTLTVVAIFWGFVECHYTVKILDDVNVVRDEAMPVARRLDEIAKQTGNWRNETVMHFGIAEGDDLPTLAPQPVLWARHQHVFAGVTWQENKERYYQYLYYLGVSPKSLAANMKSGDDFVSMIALFGWGRHTDRLNSEYKPLTFREIDAEADRFAQYIESFDPQTNGVPLTYAITETEGFTNFDGIDRFYTRDTGEQFGKYTLYRLTLK